MAKTNDDNKSLAAAAAAGASTEALATTDDNAIAEVGANGGMELELPAEFLAGLSAEIEAGLKALSIEELTASKTLLNKNLHLVDCYTNTFNFNDATERFGGLRVVFELADDAGIVYTVAKSPTGSNLKFADIFNAARKAQKKMIIPNVSFQEKGKPKAGNMPVVLCLSQNSQPIFS